MRGRGGHCTSSSSATRQRSRMALRKQSIQNISSVSQQEDENTEEDGASDSTDNRDELSSLLRSTSSTRDKRRAERKNHSKQKEMTEEEMMDLAVQLSKQEASNTALRQQREDEDVMKAIQESMVSQTQPCLSSPRKPLADGAALSTGSRRKLSYSNGEKVPEECCASQGDTNSVVRPGDDTISRSKKRKRGAGSPLPEMPDLSQNICSQSFPRSPESFPVHLDSPQSSDSTHIEDSQLQMSPVFPQTGCRAEVHINRLDLDLVETCKTSGFVLCSQDSLISTQKSGHPRSPTFPQSNQISCPKSPVFPGEHKGHQGQLEQSPKFVKSPVFDRTAECEKAPGASNHPACENVEFDFSSQESLIPTVRPSPPQSLVFPKSPPGCLPAHEDSGRGAAERSEERSETPLFGLTDQQDEPAELQGSDVHLSPSDHVKGTSDGGQTAESSRHSSKSASEEVKEESEGWNPAETELTSDMTLVWSEQDEEDVTPVGSPSPVFPEEKAGVAAASRPGSSLNHVSAASQGASGSDSSLKSQKCDPGFDKPASSGTGSSSTSAARQEPHPVGSPEAVSGVSPQPDGPSEIQTFHYYWGVPFCPRGLDPDTYTQVIVAQMEVYEKSLKQAQRSLLRKAEWGEAIQPQPQESLSPEPRAESAQPCVPRRRGLRLRGSKRSEAAGFVLEEEEDKKDEGEDEQQQEKEQEGNNEGDAAQTDTDCEVCPETQLSDNDSTKDLTLDADSETQPLQRGPELPEIQMILRDDSPTTDEPQEPDLRMKTSADPLTEENDSGCREDPGGRPAEEAGERKVNSRGPDVEEKKDRGLRGPESPELEAAVVPRSPETSVDCPICQGSFPVSEIELHAAYCDGEVAVVRQRRMDSQGYRDSVKPRRKRVRRADVESEETSSLSDVGRRQEKCYICQKLVSLRDYSSHTELCLQRGTTRRTAKGNLLSALEQTESRDSGAGPSGSKIQPEAVIDLRDDDDGEETYKISDSPIRSFTPISEATGCLIDFRKQQRTKKPSQRRR